MIKIRKLYSDPELFDPIVFVDGINLILGETNETTLKTNGVGKSLCIEFINYCLLKKHSDSRVSRIPETAFPFDALICLDFEVNSIKVTSKRCIGRNYAPTLIVDGTSTDYYNIDDALKQLTSLLYGSVSDTRLPSFREILGPLIRDERSEFKSIINCYDTNKKIPPNYAPHLYILGIDPTPYDKSNKLYGEIEKIKTTKSKTKRNVEELTGKKFSEAKADLNELSSKVERIKKDMDLLENTEGFEIVKDELIDIEEKLDAERNKQAVIKSEIAKISFFKGDNYINDTEVADLYNRFKKGLGDIIKKEIGDVTLFKKKIDNFQKTLIDSRREALLEKLHFTGKVISNLDRAYKEKLSLIDHKGALKNLKQTIATYQKKLEELAQLSTFITTHDKLETEQKINRLERDSMILKLESLVIDAKASIKAVEETILEIHEYVAGNRISSFDVNIGDRKETVSFDLRIHDDGSHSNEREKVFFYDIAIMITEETAKRHPGLLVHDNIFDVDQDTLLKSLNYLNGNSHRLANKQYILTINSDKFSAADIEAKLKLDIQFYTRAAFTKNKKFLKKDYQET